MKTTKRRLSILLTAALIMALLPASFLVSASDAIAAPTMLDPNDFAVRAGTVDLTVNGSAFSMKRSANAAEGYNWPDTGITCRVDLDKVPVLTVETDSITANYKIHYREAGTETWYDFYGGDTAKEYAPADTDVHGLKKLNLAEARSWSGVKTIEIMFYIIVNDYPLDSVNSFKGIGFEAVPQEQEKPVIEAPETLDPNDFVVQPGTVDLTVNGTGFAMKRSADAAEGFNWPDMTLTRRVNLDKVPYLIVDLKQAQANLKIHITEVGTENTISFYADDLATEHGPRDTSLLGPKTVNLKEKGDWSGVKKLEIKIYIIVNGFPLDSVNTFTSLKFSDSADGGSDEPPVGAVIEAPTVLDPAEFTVLPNTVDLTVDGNAFTMKKNENCGVDWPNFTIEVTVDVDKVPYLCVDVGEAQANYIVRFREKGSEREYNFYSDEVGFERSPVDPVGLNKLDLRLKTEWSGVKTMLIDVYIVVVNYDQDSVNSFKSIAFDSQGVDDDDDDDDDDNNDSSGSEFDPGDDPWSSSSDDGNSDSSDNVSAGDEIPDTGHAAPVAALLLTVLAGGALLAARRRQS